MTHLTNDYGKLKHISNHLFGASPIQLDVKYAQRLAKKIAEKALADYRAHCRAALIKKGLIKPPCKHESI